MFVQWIKIIKWWDSGLTGLRLMRIIHIQRLKALKRGDGAEALAPRRNSGMRVEQHSLWTRTQFLLLSRAGAEKQPVGCNQFVCPASFKGPAKSNSRAAGPNRGLPLPFSSSSPPPSCSKHFPKDYFSDRLCKSRIEVMVLSREHAHVRVSLA